MTPSQDEPVRGPEPRTHDAITRRIALGGSLLLLATLLWPVGQNWVDAPTDGFPLSYYPMFTKRRGQTTVVHHAVAVDAAGARTNLPSTYAGQGGMNTTRRQMRKMVRQGRAQELAEQVARRLRESGEAERLGVVRVEVVESVYDIPAFLSGDRRTRSRTTHASVPVNQGDLS